MEQLRKEAWVYSRNKKKATETVLKLAELIYKDWSNWHLVYCSNVKKNYPIPCLPLSFDHGLENIFVSS